MFSEFTVLIPRLGLQSRLLGAARHRGERAPRTRRLPHLAAVFPVFWKRRPGLRGAEVRSRGLSHCLWPLHLWCRGPSSEGLAYALHICPQLWPLRSLPGQLRLRWAEAPAQRIMILAARLPLLHRPWSRVLLPPSPV